VLILVVVRKAWALGRKCFIVVRDWLEDSLIGNSKKKTKRAEKPYTLNRVLKRVHRGLEDKKRYQESFEEGVRAGKELVDNRTGTTLVLSFSED